MTKTLVKGSWYTVTTTTSCTVTDADGRTLGTAEEGKQFSFKATTENITFSDDAAVVQSENFNCAPAKLRALGLLGGGSKVAPLMKYAHCVTVADMKAVNPDYQNDLTSEGEWIYPLPNITNANNAFRYVKALKLWRVALLVATKAEQTFQESALIVIDLDAPLLTHGIWTFGDCKELERVRGRLLSLRIGDYMCHGCKNLTIWDIPLPSLTTGDAMFYGCIGLIIFNAELSRLYKGNNMFRGCILNKDSALLVLNSIPSWTDGVSHSLTIGIHIDHQTDEEVTAAIANAEAKGWTLAVQWNGTPTVQTASTFGLRKPPIYAKLSTIDGPDGTTENVLDWGHYVTDWEANGYREFGSVEEAKEYFNIIDEA